MSTSSLALARERLKTIAETQSALVGKCALLANIHAADLGCLKRYTPGALLFLAVCESELSYPGVDAPTAIHAYFYARVGDASAGELDDWMVLLKSVWTDSENFPDGELVCQTVTFSAYETFLEEPAAAVLRAHVICYFDAV